MKRGGGGGGETRPVNMRFVLDNVALGKIFLRVLRFSCQYNSATASYQF